jgi:MOSC domain-containing protein YiiM
VAGQQFDLAALEAGVDWVRGSPVDRGSVELIVRRPAADEREVVSEAMLDARFGVVGDSWRVRRLVGGADGGIDPDTQVALMNARAVALVAGSVERWALAGDQLYVDFDLSVGRVPAGTRLSVGEAVVEITDEPHLGCHKFARRFGVDARRFVNSDVGRELRLRGVMARVVVGGVVRTGDVIAIASAVTQSDQSGSTN